ncbi:MAG: FtsQ-type POTRA domain-containing protein [Rhodospirillaceae bacterium]
MSKASDTGMKAAAAGKPRRRVRTIVTRARLTATGLLLLVALAAAGTWWSVRTDALTRTTAQAKWHLIGALARLGFRVNDILVVGRQETPRAELLKAVRLSRGAPILAFDIEAARARVEALPWVRRARVERMLPDTVLLDVEERQPLALWQNKGKFALIDHDGEVILRDGLERFANLVVVVGEDAPRHAAGLLETLGHEPELLPLVKAAVWVGGRRWNVRLAGDIDVRLPEKDPKAAWTRLAEYERAHRVLERDVQVLDLRLPDRLIVRKAPKPDPALKTTERET